MVVAECTGTPRITYFDQFYTRNCTDPFTSPPPGFPSELTFDAFKARNCSKIIVRQFFVRDYFDNESTTKQIIYVKNATFFDVICPTGVEITCKDAPLNTAPDTLEIEGQLIAGTGIPRFSTGESLQTGSCRIQPIWKDTRFDFNDGTYLIRRQWIFFNGCDNNIDTCYQNIFVNDGMPFVACKSNFIAQLTAAKTVVIKTQQVISTVYDACTPVNQLQFGIRKAGQGSGFPTVDSLKFGCAELGTYAVEVWVKDQSGKIAQCNTTIKIEDANNFCAPPPPQYKRQNPDGRRQ